MIFTYLAFVACLVLQAGAEDAASALSPEAFAPTSRVTGIILPNPDNTTCWVLIGVKQIGTTPSIQVEPTASPVASSVRSILSLQVESLNQTAYVGGFDLVADMPPNAEILSASNVTSTGVEMEGEDGWASYKLHSVLSLPSQGSGSKFVNCTVSSLDQDVLPRNVFLNGTRCALALESTRTLSVVGAPLFLNIAPARTGK